MEAFILGLVGTALSVVSLCWQAFTWRAAGARLHVSFTTGMPITQHGPPVMLTGITVTNRGRASTIVSGVTARLPDRKHFPLTHDALGQVTFPSELRPGESITAYYEEDGIETTMRKVGISRGTKLTPVASCGHGEARGKAVALG